MATITSVTAIKLGNFGELDPTEPYRTWFGASRGRGAENAGDLVGETFGSASDPLYGDISTMDLYDADEDNLVHTGDGTFNSGSSSYRGDHITFDGADQGVDAIIIYGATITYADPNIPDASNIPVRIIQDGDGNLYLVPPIGSSSQAEIDALTQHAIESITITSVIDATDADVAASRFGLTNFVCFAAGTLISTDRGEVAIENLAEGDMVFTRDNGYQALRWIGSKTLKAADLDAQPKLRPIRIKAGALGENVPARDLLVSPQHRVLVRSKIAQKMFGTNEVLVAAKQLCQIEGIDIAEDMAGVEYFHMLFDRHEVVLSNGAETESLYTGPEALKSLGKAALDEIFAIFPELQDRDYAPQGARHLTSGRLGRKLAVRHKQNGKALVS